MKCPSSISSILQWKFFVLLIISLLCTVLIILKSSIWFDWRPDINAAIETRSSALSATRRALFEWKTKPPARIISKNVLEDCEMDGNPVCCALLTNTTAEEARQAMVFTSTPHAIAAGGSSHHDGQSARHRIGSLALIAGSAQCTIEKVYVPSQYELRHIEQAQKIHDVNPGDYLAFERLDALVDFLVADIEHSNRWLERVRVHMQSTGDSNSGSSEGGGGGGTKTALHPDDFKYLSRFEVTKTCPGGASDARSFSWLEWIEPLTVHARHPFAYMDCYPFDPIKYHIDYIHKHADKMKFESRLTGVDYVLVQSGGSLLNRTLSAHQHQLQNQHSHVESSDHQQPHQQTTSSSAGLRSRQQQIQTQAHHRQSKHFLFDAGTSTFDSSLVWFLCAYLQVSKDILLHYGLHLHSAAIVFILLFYTYFPPNLIFPRSHVPRSPVPMSPLSRMGT